MSPAIGVDIGGTKIAAGLVSETGQILASDAEPTPDDSSRIPAIVADLVDRLARDHEPVGVGIGAAGFVGEDRSTVRFAPNIDWVSEPLGAHVRELVDLPVVVENDANAAAWGEFRFGAGEDTDDLLLITVGTGIGGGIVHQGQLFRGGFGVAAEIGHMRIVPDGILCGCGQHGCYEQYGSGSALVREARARLASEDPGAAALAALAAGDPEQITGPAVTQLREGRRPAGDRAAR
ncbi:ROK family protein [Aeromicrobium sp. UC242_57]|uniref:ROK family protein n=1 Tax=Aeromicrobium sp. UC242_57 TaxID=3374624 RepID=UPI0037B2D834